MTASTIKMDIPTSHSYRRSLQDCIDRIMRSSMRSYDRFSAFKSGPNAVLTYPSGPAGLDS